MALKLLGRVFGKKNAKNDYGHDDVSPEHTVILENFDDTHELESPPKDVYKILIPGLGHRPVAEQLRILGLLLGLFVLVSIVLAAWQVRKAGQSTAFISAVTQLGTQSQVLAKSTLQAMTGNDKGFEQVEESRLRIELLLKAITDGGAVDGVEVPSISSSETEGLGLLARTWGDIDKKAQYLNQQRHNMFVVKNAISKVNRQNESLLKFSQIAADMKLNSKKSSIADIAEAFRVSVLSQRMMKSANAQLSLNVFSDSLEFDRDDNIRALKNDADELTKLLDRVVKSGDGESNAQYENLKRAVGEHLKSVQDILNLADDVARVKSAGSQIFDDSGSLLKQANVLSSDYKRNHADFNMWLFMAMVSGLLALLSLVLLNIVYNNDWVVSRSDAEKQRRKVEVERKQAEFERNNTQQAILRLMNEMSDLADGDLTIRATVTEDLTGAIADAVNYTIEELSVLVGQINGAAGRVTSATESAQHISGELLGASERQSREIQQAGSQVQDMARQMSSVSSNALQTSSVAHRALASARKGASAVQDSIKGMNEIREQIQETSKRIKRLGESSQEIGEIVELISDITEQTNVLALNAAIQAASAGEAGRGFTVVAEEVQRLAERSAEATKQIASIVQTIQVDTQDAVAAMENSTRDVVHGARLSDAAGQALLEIGKVSVEMTSLVEKISKDTQRQASVAVEVSESMRDILAITEQTTRGTQQSAVSIGELADLAIELKGSVSGFRVD